MPDAERDLLSAQEKLRDLTARLQLALEAGNLRTWNWKAAADQLEQALRQADVRKDQFLASLAHELRNPLAPLRTSLELLRQEGISRDAKEDTRMVILRQVDQMVALIDDLIDISRISTGRIEPNRERVALALSLARRLAELHGDTLEARSGGLGNGSESTLRLKTASAAPVKMPPSAPAATIQDSRRRRVLVVDDNVDHADSLANLLRLQGHEVHTAYDGLAAIDAVMARRPEIVLLDIGMPGLNGYDAARRIRALDQMDETLLIALSGWGQPKDRQLSQDSGFDYHLVKPVDSAVMQRMMMEERNSVRAQEEVPLRILLVDDNPDLQASLAVLLQGTGRDIRTAENGERAVEMAKDWRPAVVFVDIHMPGLNGFQVAKRLREEFSPSAMKLVLMSGVSIDETLARDAKQAGFDACIDKMATPAFWLRQLDPAATG